jgi:hypothetical protein
MQQEKNDIENKFLQLENDAEADLSQIDTHWAQMKNTLAMQSPKTQIPKRWAWLSLPVIAIVGFLLFFANRNSNNIAKVNDDIKLGYKVKTEIKDTTSFQKNNGTSSQNETTIIETKKQTKNSLTNIKSTTSNKINKTASINKYKNLDKTKSLADTKTITNTNIAANSKTDSTNINNDVAHAKNIEILNNFISKIQKKGELFTINNLRDTTIKAAEGTVFYIPMNSFNTPDSVVFEVKEYYKYSDMVANGLTTMADDKQLISGGMLSLTATVKGKEVAMNPAKEIRVFIPNLTAKDSMEIFVGKKTKDSNLKVEGITAQNNINWQLTDRSFLPPNSSMYLRAIDLRDDKVKERKTLFTNKNVGIFLRSTKSEISKDTLIMMLRKKYGSYYDIIKVRNIWKRNLLFRKRDMQGDWGIIINDTRGIGDTIEFKPQDIRLFGLDIIDTIFRSVISTGRSFVNTDLPLFSQKALKMIDNKYSIGINKLGWINCDRFYNYGGEKQDIYVNVNDNAKNYITYLVFENYKSIMNGYWSNKEFKFPNVPLGIPAKIISIGVKNGQTIVAMKSIVTSKNIISDLQFEEVTSTEVKENLQTFDKLKN